MMDDERRGSELVPTNGSVTPSETGAAPGAGSPEWYISVTFGTSSSQNYPQAVALAKLAPQYYESTQDGRLRHQAVFSGRPPEYLAFVKLYELVREWKSCFVVSNGALMDRKIIGQINYCYGDRCRSGNRDFCYGASQFTANPFGCHRLQVSDYNNAWWSFGRLDTAGIWHVDKSSILKRMQGYAEVYHFCPAFDWKRATEALAELPETIDHRVGTEWVLSGDHIVPKKMTEPVAHLTVEIGSSTKRAVGGCGCLGAALAVSIAVALTALVL